MKTLVIYHKADWDGLFSREICRRHFGDTAEYLGWDYGDPVPAVEPERSVVMVDISVDGLMTHPVLTWIDHHKSAIEKFPATIPGYRIDGVAACRLAWQYFESLKADGEIDKALLPSKQMFIDRLVHEPYAVQLAGEYDIWDKRNPDAETFQHALRSQPISDHIWRELLRTEIEDCITQVQHSQIMAQALMPLGRAIQFSSAEANASLVGDASFVLEWEGLRFLALNKPRANSLTFTSAVKPEHDGLLTFYWLRNKWRISLYHAPHRTDIDLSKIAVKHGGGGHRGACGFESQSLPFSLS